MTSAIIFDCFGVLTSDGWKQIREEFFANDPEKMRHALDIDKAVNAGFMKYDKFIAEISRMTGLSESEVKRRMNEKASNTILFNYIRDNLKPRFKIGMLSNMAGNWLDQLFEPWQRELFDAVVLSYETGSAKPDAAIYNLTAERLGVGAADCLFIDDIERYCTAAREVGMQAVLHTDSHETIRKIEKLINA